MYLLSKRVVIIFINIKVSEDFAKSETKMKKILKNV